MNGSNQKRTVFINNALHEFRGILALEFYFTNEDYPYIPYYYDPNDDCLHADEVSVPFHYKEEEITNKVISDALDALEDKLRDYFEKEKGIILYEYD
jgi:hypothetical protein